MIVAPREGLVREGEGLTNVRAGDDGSLPDTTCDKGESQQRERQRQRG